MPALAPAPLSRLRAELARLRRRRAAVRLGTAIATAALILLALLVAALAIDYLARLRPTPRAVAWLGLVLVGAWSARRFVRPWLGGRETETDVALLVERQQGLEGDLVAALQFQSPEAPAWGSPQLERAVVGYVDDASHDLSVFDGFTWAPLPKRLIALGVTLAALALAAFLFPAHATAFARRLALADVPYPTRTQITAITINGKSIDLDGRPPLSAPAGQPLSFAVTSAGQRPAAGHVAFESDAGGAMTLPLKADPQSNFAGVLEALTEPVMFIVYLGDAETRPRRIELVPLPSVSIALKPTPPAYARANAPPAPPAGVRTASVLEGSDVTLTALAANKPLAQAALNVGKKAYPLAPSPDRKTWTLRPAGTPLADIRAPIDFTLTAVDDQGLSLPEPLKGSIRLRADRPPRVAAGAVVRRVLPSGRPELTYGAADDFGIDSVTARVTINRASGKADESTIPLPLQGETTNEVRGRHPLDLAPFALEKGDSVVVTVEAADARGDRPGETATAEPITFEVTDREGLIASLLETDEEGASRLDEIIRRQLGIGGER